jgi:hypothetical protein
MAIEVQTNYAVPLATRQHLRRLALARFAREGPQMLPQAEFCGHMPPVQGVEIGWHTLCMGLTSIRPVAGFL